MNTRLRPALASSSMAIAVFPSVLCSAPVTVQDTDWRTIEFETTEVTAPDVAISPDDHWLIFTLLGHLFRLPVTGGVAEQLTFGPYYDTDPVWAPDGRRVAFVSDRDGGLGNVFVLDLETRLITQVTHDLWAIHPAFSPDGAAIAYVSLERHRGGARPIPAHIRRVHIATGATTTLSDSSRPFGSPFFMADGRLAWSVREQQGGQQVTRIEVSNPDGVVPSLAVAPGRLLRPIAFGAGDAVMARHYAPGSGVPQLVSFRLGDASPVPLMELSPERARRSEPRIAVTETGERVYVGQGGGLWAVSAIDGARERITFRAVVRMEVSEPVAAPQWEVPPPDGSIVRPTISHPRVSPDGRTLVMEAAGHLWQQALDDSEPATLLFPGPGQAHHASFSPDGRHIAFLHFQHGVRELRVGDLRTGAVRTLASGLLGEPSWEPTGGRIVVADFYGGGREGHTIMAVDPRTGEAEQLALAPPGRAFPRPHLSGDGRWLYFTASPFGGTPDLVRVGVGRAPSEPERLSQIDRGVRDALVSLDGRWVAFRRNAEIWISPLDGATIDDSRASRLSGAGGLDFAFSPDGSSVVYAVGSRVWRQRLPDGPAEEIPVRITVPRRTAPAVLLRRVRLLDDAGAGFSPETSLLIENGRISSIGADETQALPADAEIIDAGGRFAIPGLFDMHVHLRGAHYEAFLAYGITSLRLTGGSISLVHQLDERSEASGEPIPRLFSSDQVINGEEGVFAEDEISIVDEEEARRVVRQQAQRGAQFIKVYWTLPWPLQRVVAEEARRLELPVVGHGTNIEEITRSVTLGFSVLEHIPPSRFYDDVLNLFSAAGTRWDPTLALTRVRNLLFSAEPQRLQDSKLQAFALAPALARLQRRVAAGLDPARERRATKQLASIRDARASGARLLAGTDVSAGPWAGLFGTALHWELELLVLAGLSPAEALRIATRDAAETVGASAHLGSLEVGKLADIVLLDGSPLADIRNTQQIWRVIKGGWVFDPQALRPPDRAR